MFAEVWARSETSGTVWPALSGLSVAGALTKAIQDAHRVAGGVFYSSHRRVNVAEIEIMNTEIGGVNVIHVQMSVEFTYKVTPGGVSGI